MRKPLHLESFGTSLSRLTLRYALPEKFVGGVRRAEHAALAVFDGGKQKEVVAVEIERGSVRKSQSESR